MKNFIYKFSSLPSIIEYALKHADHEKGSSILGANSEEWSDNYDFLGFVKDFKEFENKNKDRDSDHLNYISSLLGKYIDQYKYHFMPQNLFEEYHSNSGSIVDIPRYIENDPECMIDFYNQKTIKSYSIVFEMCGNVSYSRHIKRAGQIIYCLNRILKNRSIKIYGYMHGKSERNDMHIHILAPFEKALRPHQELIFLNLKAFFRKILFAVMESIPMADRIEYGILDGPKGGYGYSGGISLDNIRTLFKINPDIIIDNSYFEYNDIDQSCTKIINDLIKAEKKNG